MKHTTDVNTNNTKVARTEEAKLGLQLMLDDHGGHLAARCLSDATVRSMTKSFGKIFYCGCFA
jgi:hypothetical protein